MSVMEYVALLAVVVQPRNSAQPESQLKSVVLPVCRAPESVEAQGPG